MGDSFTDDYRRATMGITVGVRSIVNMVVWYFEES